MPSFKMFRSFHSANAIKTRVKKGYTLERQTNHLGQTLKLFKCEENANYLHDFCSRPSIWILRINS